MAVGQVEIDQHSSRKLNQLPVLFYKLNFLHSPHEILTRWSFSHGHAFHIVPYKYISELFIAPRDAYIHCKESPLSSILHYLSSIVCELFKLLSYTPWCLLNVYSERNYLALGVSCLHFPNHLPSVHYPILLLSPPPQRTRTNKPSPTFQTLGNIILLDAFRPHETSTHHWRSQSIQ